jgi:Rps23 Pro-64 3,4-dihydroxylase Tpa1-like proline 4-hydroxylase
VTQAPFQLNPTLDPERLASVYRKEGRIHIPDLLEADNAHQLHRSLKAESRWKLVFNQGDRLFELDRAAQAALSSEQKGQLDSAIHHSARYGFQYCYETIRVPDEPAERERSNTLLDQFASFLSSSAMLSFLGIITGEDRVNFADAQATAYAPGHFLTAHDDEVSGKNRAAAYVYNLTPTWRVDWGGLLQFEGDDGHVSRAFTPALNALNLFSVPQRHSVSIVAPFAASRRYAMTGWLRHRGSG